MIGNSTSGSSGEDCNIVALCQPPKKPVGNRLLTIWSMKQFGRAAWCAGFIALDHQFHQRIDEVMISGGGASVDMRAAFALTR
eukprot:6485458-Amphidinium_carterae.1